MRSSWPKECQRTASLAMEPDPATDVYSEERDEVLRMLGSPVVPGWNVERTRG